MSLPDAEHLPQLEAEEERALALLLRHANAPAAIDAARHERLLQAALLDPFAEASDEERAQSERLRRALSGDGDHPSLALARALSAAHRAHAASLPPAASAPQLRSRPDRPSKRSFARWGALGASLALAAAVVLFVLPPGREPARTASGSAVDLPALALAQSRSTAPLFVGEAPGPASTRIDRIASARQRDLRDNRFAAWGVP